MIREIKKLEKSIANIKSAVESKNKEIKEKACNDVATFLKSYGVPITGGNLFQAIAERESINNMFNRDGDGFPSEMTMKHYFALLDQAKYWQNLFIVQNWEDLDADTQKAIKIAFATLYIYGYIGLYRDPKTKKIIPCILTGEIKCDEYGYPIECTGYPAGMCYQYGVMDFDYDNKNVNVSKDWKDKLPHFDLNQTNCVFGKWNVWGYGAWILEIPFINKLINYLERVNTACALTGLMLKRKSIDGNSLAESEHEILNNRGIISEVAGKESTFGDKYEVMDVGQAGNTMKALIDSAEWLRQWYYSMNGRRFNINEKQERNINSEVMYSQLNFDVLENEHLRELQIMFKQLNKKFKINIEVSSPIVEDDLMNENDYEKLQSEGKDFESNV